MSLLLCCMNQCLPEGSLVNLSILVCLRMLTCICQLQRAFALCVWNSTKSITWTRNEGYFTEICKRVLEGIKSLISTDQHNKKYYKHFFKINKNLYVTFNICGGYSFYKMTFNPYLLFSANDYDNTHTIT